MKKKARTNKKKAHDFAIPKSHTQQTKEKS
jgi:hypothetical protein